MFKPGVTQANAVEVNLSQNNFFSGFTCLGTNEACYKEAAACPAGTKENTGKECFLKTLKCCITGKLLVMRPLLLVSHVEQTTRGRLLEAWLALTVG